MKSIAQFRKTPGNLDLNGAFDVLFPLGVKLTFSGAPFRHAHQGKMDGRPPYRVKCATEQSGACEIEVPCQDFGTPTHEDMLAGVEAAIDAAFAGKPVFAGCAGGIGRTGTFLAVVLKALNAEVVGFEHVPLPWWEKVRIVYLKFAVETKGQKDLIEDIDVSAIRRRIKWLWAKAVFRKMMGR